jgi:hypothetical protein
MSKPDNNYLSIADVENKHLKNCLINPKSEGLKCEDFDDILKFSHAVHCSIKDSTISGEGVNRENAIDMNRLCADIVVQNCAIVSGLQNAITIKGGCEEILIKDCIIVPGEGNCDIDLGNYSDQCQCPVIDVRLVNVTRSDNQPVRVRVINADIPDVTGGNVVITRPYWGRFPIWNIYSFFRRKGIL